MPYRRLPNTDKARLTALEKAVEESDCQELNEIPISFKLLQDARTQKRIFDKNIQLYNASLKSQIAANKQYKQIIKNIRLYISHFIQVLNFSVIRGEIKKENKTMYHLSPDDITVPDLSTETALIQWGKNIIEGENERIRKGGVPIYNPTIAKVKVHYDIFKEYKNSQTIFQQSTKRFQDTVASMRPEIDKLILEIWNQIEERYADMPPTKRYEYYKRFGIVYYLRKGEKSTCHEFSQEKQSNIYE